MLDNLKKYTTTYIWHGERGALLSTQTFANGNVLYATGQLLALSSLYDMTRHDRAKYITGIRLCRAPNGAYARKPGDPDNTSVDDYIAIGCNPLVASQLLHTGRRRLGFLNINEFKINLGFIKFGISKPKFAQFIYRFQGLWQHLRISAGEKPGLFGQFMWALAIYLAAKEPVDNQDSWIESHLMVLTRKWRKFESKICDKAEAYWRAKRGDIKTSEVMAQYIGDPDHDLVTLWRRYD